MPRAAIACLWLVLGCEQVTGLDDYSIDDGPVPYLDGADCRACLQTNCGPEVDACEVDVLCRDTLACRRQCSDPDCHFQCGYRQDEFERAWNELGFPQPADDPVARCAMRFCVESCSIGSSWKCNGDYEWRRPDVGDLTIRHRAFATGAWAKPVSGATVRVCRRGDPDCYSGALAQGSTLANGTVELTLPGITNSDLYLRVDAEPTYPPHMLLGSFRPRFSNEYTGNGMTPIDVVEKSRGMPFDATRAYLFPQFSDCNGLWSNDLVVELWTTNGKELVPCSGCTPIYTENGAPSITATHTTPQAGAQALFIRVAPGPVVMLARDRTSGTLVSRTELIIQPGRVYLMNGQPVTVTQAQND
jgi:hypothetical protein